LAATTAMLPLQLTSSHRGQGVHAAKKVQRAASSRMALGVGDPFPPKLLSSLCSLNAQRLGKRVIIFFFDESGVDELSALDEIGGELYLKACELVAVRNPTAPPANPKDFMWLSFAEDRRGRMRDELGLTSACSSVVTDATGTVVSIATKAHAANALEAASECGWEREPGWERDFGGSSDGELPTAAARQATDAAAWMARRKALRLPEPAAAEKTEVEELFSTGIFAEWQDPEDLPNPVGDNLKAWGGQMRSGAQSALQQLQDDALDAFDAATGAAEDQDAKRKKGPQD